MSPPSPRGVHQHGGQAGGGCGVRQAEGRAGVAGGFGGGGVEDAHRTPALTRQHGDAKRLQAGADLQVSPSSSEDDALVGVVHLVHRDASEQRQPRGVDVVGVVDAVLGTRAHDDDCEREQEAGDACRRGRTSPARAACCGSDDGAGVITWPGSTAPVWSSASCACSWPIWLVTPLTCSSSRLFRAGLVSAFGPGPRGRPGPCSGSLIWLSMRSVFASGDLLRTGLAEVEVGLGEALGPRTARSSDPAV